MRTVQGRLALINSLVILLALALSGLLLFFQMDRHFAQRDTDQVLRRLQALVRILNENPQVDRQWLLGVVGELGGLGVEVLPPSAAPSASQGALPRPLTAARSPMGLSPDQADSVLALYSEGEVVGYLRAENLYPERALFRRAMWTNLALVMVPSFLVAAAAGMGLSRAVTRPLGAMAAASAEMAQGNLTRRVLVAGPAELRTLAQRFNQMAAALEASFAAEIEERDRLRRLISELSHELKTPLTALLTFNELMESELERGAAADASAVAPAEPAAYGLVAPGSEAAPPVLRFVRESRRQLQRLQWLIQTLLDLSRLDAGVVQLATVREPLEGTVEKVLATLTPMAQQKQVALAVEGDLTAPAVPHDPHWLEQALTNLVENALRFTPAGGRVALRLVAGEGRVGLRVADTGPGIPPADLPRVFDRFYRGSNQPPGESRGSGLGLAVVQAVARAHGGEAAAQNGSGAGAVFTLWLPLDRDEKMTKS